MMKAMVVGALAVVGLVGCASGPRVGSPQEVDGVTQTAGGAAVVAKPDLPGAPPWMVVGRWAVVSESVEGFEPSGELEATEAEGVSFVFSVAPDALVPAAAKAWAAKGRRLALVNSDGDKGCEVVVGRALVGAFLTDSDAGFHAIYMEEEYDDEGNVVRTVPEQERYRKAVEGQRMKLVVELIDVDLLEQGGVTGGSFEGCGPDETVAHHVAVDAGRALARAEAPVALRERALKAFRDHGFWEVQQASYQQSVEELRKRSREEYEAEIKEAVLQRATKAQIAEIYRDTRAEEAPPTWDQEESEDEGSEGNAYSGRYASMWVDGQGRPRYLVAILGNQVSCAAPRGWMLFRVEGEALTVLDFGVRAWPVAVVERGAGGEEVLFGTWDPRSLARVEGERLVPVRGNAVSDGLHCSYGQIPPVKHPRVDHGRYH